MRGVLDYHRVGPATADRRVRRWRDSPVLLLRAAHIVGNLAPDRKPAAVLPGLRMTSPHDVSDACRDVHCYSCAVDEPYGGYITCPECFHTYRTARELRRAFRREYVRVNRTPMPLPDFVDDPGPRWGRTVWRLLTVRARDINFCQHCTHDF